MLLLIFRLKKKWVNEGVKIDLNAGQYLARAILHPCVVVVDTELESGHKGGIHNGKIKFDNFLHLKVRFSDTVHILVYDRVIHGKMGVEYVHLYFQVVCIFVVLVCLVVCLKENNRCMKGIVINVREIL